MICGYAFILVTVLAVVGIFITGAGAPAVPLFVLGIFGTAASTVAVASAQSNVRRPISGPG